MKKNVASQVVGIQMINKTDGSNVTTGTTTVYVTGDGGTQAAGSVGSGACTHEGKGFWTYAPAQAETNYDHVAFTFENTSAVTASIQLYPSFPQTGDNFARLGAPAGASVSADVAAVKADTAAVKTKTDFLPSATAGAAGGVFIAGTNAATTITTSLTTTFTGNLTGSVASVTGAVGSVTGAVGSVTGNVGGNVTGSVGSVAAGGITASSFAADAITAAKIAADVTTELQAGLATSAAVSTLQTSVDDIPTNAELATALGTADDAVLAQVALVKAKTDLIPAAPAAVSDIPTAAANADAVWDEAIAGHVGAGSTGEALANATAPSAATVADAVWDEAIAGHLGAGSTGLALNSAGSAGDPWATALPGAYGSGTAGKIVGDNINATISSRATQTSVDDVPTNAELATALGTADDAVLAQVALVKAKTDLIPAAPAAVADVPTTAQIADKLLGRNLAGGSDGGRMVKDALRVLRNKASISAGVMTVTEEDDTTTAWTAAIATAPGDPLVSIDPT